jgi:hypothetical protein
MSRWRGTIAPPITSVAATPATLVRANPRRCRLILGIPSGVTFSIDTNEPGSFVNGLSWSNLQAPLILDEEDFGDIVERALAYQCSGAITFRVLEVFDTERKV